MPGYIQALFVVSSFHTHHQGKTQQLKGSTNPHTEQRNYFTFVTSLFVVLPVISSSLLFISPANFLAEKIANSGFRDTECMEICT
jgi:hypothetical protein